MRLRAFDGHNTEPREFQWCLYAPVAGSPGRRVAGAPGRFDGQDALINDTEIGLSDPEITGSRPSATSLR